MAKGDLNKNIEGAKETMDELLFATRDFTDEVKKSAKEVFGIGTSASQATKAFKDIGSSLSSMASSIDGIVEGTKTTKDLAKEQNKYYEKRNKFSTEYRQALSKTKLTKEQISKIVAGELDYEKAIYSQLDKMDPALSSLLDKYHEQAKINSENEDTMKEMAGRAKEIQKGVGLAGAAFSAMGGIIKKAGLGDLGDKMGLDKAVTEGRKLSAELTEGGENSAGIGDKLRVAGKMASTIGKNLLASFGPMALIAKAVSFLIEALKSVDKNAGELAKNMGISYDEALKLGGEFIKMAEDSGDIMVSGEDILKTQKSLNKYFGTGAKFTGDIVGNMASIQKRTQLSDEAMGFYYKNAKKSGKPIKDILKNVNKTVIQQNYQRKLNMSFKQVQESIAKTSSTVKLHAKGNVTQLTKSVMAAKELGASMETIEGIGSSLLDFESSIAAEMEAELLLGKDINLEKARGYALEGNMLGLTKEIMNNKAIMDVFDGKNVLKQEAAAKALGLTRQQLADMIIEQENINVLQDAFGEGVTSMSEAQEIYNQKREEGKTHEEAILGLSDKSLANQLKSTSIAEKFDATMLKIKDKFNSLATKILPRAERILDGMVEAIKWFVKGLKEGEAGAVAVTAALGALVIASIIKAVAGVWAGAMQLGPIAGPILAGVLTAGLFIAIAAARSTAISDGVIGPGGEMIVSGPKGSIQLDKQDSIIAGTNLGGKGGGDEGEGEGTNPNTDEMIFLLKEIANKTTVIEMGGNEVGQGINTAEREIQ